MKVVEPIKASMHVPTALRHIADQIDRGDLEVPGDVGTLILNSEIFHIGKHIADDRAAMQAAWDCRWGIEQIMRGAMAGGENGNA